MLFELLIVLVELSKFVRQDVSIWTEIEMLFTKALLHSHDIEAKSIFPCDFVALGKMIDFLVLIKSLIKIAFAT